MSDIDLKRCDLLQFSKMCAPEYNTPELSDRVLVLDVMQDGWETASIPEHVSSTKSDQTATSTGVFDDSEKFDESQDEKVEEGTLSEVKRDVDTGCQSENISNDLQKNTSEQNSQANEVESLSNPLFQDSTEDVTTISEKPILTNNFNEPIRHHKIYVHSFWLSVQSPYFRSLFYSSGMKENHDHEVHVKVSESEENAYLILLEAMYRNDVLNDKTVDELLAVLELANKHDLQFVFMKCKYVLQKNATTFEISTQVMKVIKVKHNMNDVEDLATTLQLVLAKEFSPLDNHWQSEKFTNLSEPSLKYLLSSDDLIVQSENTVFHALMYWMEQNEIDPAGLEETNGLLAVVRFKLVTIDYLYNMIKNHPVASKMPNYGELYLSGMTYHAIPSEQKQLLEAQPVCRKKSERAIIQHTFSRKMDSVEFWVCGYKMKIELSRRANSNRTSYEYRPYLSVQNLNKESLIRLKFSVSRSESNINWCEGTFVSNSCRKEYWSTFSSSDVANSNLYVAVAPY